MVKKIKTSGFTPEEHEKFQEMERADKQAKNDQLVLESQAENYDRDSGRMFAQNDPSLTGRKTARDYTYNIENKDLQSKTYTKVATDIIKRKMNYLKNVQEKSGDDKMLEQVDNVNQYKNRIKKHLNKK
jgi:hypothetical protein